MTWLEQLASFRTILDPGVVVVSVLIMRRWAWSWKPSTRAVARERWKVVLSVLAAQAVLLPLLAVAITRVLEFPPHLSAGILLVAACSAGTSSGRTRSSGFTRCM